MNAERILIAAECIGDAKWFIEKATAYAKERNVFGRAIGQNQGVAFPIARAYAGMRAAELMVREAAALYEAHKECGAEANMAKHLAAEGLNRKCDTVEPGVERRNHGGARRISVLVKQRVASPFDQFESPALAAADDGFRVRGRRC